MHAKLTGYEDIESAKTIKGNVKDSNIEACPRKNTLFELLNKLNNCSLQ